jgi:hypothetical protein
VSHLQKGIEGKFGHGCPTTAVTAAETRFKCKVLKKNKYQVRLIKRRPLDQLFYNI